MGKNLRALFCSAFVLMTIAALVGCFPKEKPTAAATVQISDSVFLLDVRSADEFASGHLKGARLIPHTDIGSKIDGITTDKASEIYLYCRSGRRSNIARETLEKLGYTRIHDLGSMEKAAETTGLSVVTE